jgi:hypothetical protein
MDMEPLHRVDPSEAEEGEDPTDLLPAPDGLLQCQEYAILIGPGYIETAPFAHPTRSGAVCWPCFQSLERRARRGDASRPQHAWDPRQRR